MAQNVMRTSMWGFVLPLREADDWRCVCLDAESPDLERSLAPPEVVDGSLGVDGGHQRVPIHGALRDVSSCSSPVAGEARGLGQFIYQLGSSSVDCWLAV